MFTRRQDTMNRQSGPPPLMSMLNYNQFFMPADNLNRDQRLNPNEGMGPRRQNPMNRQSGPQQRMLLPTPNYNQFFTPADNLNSDQSRHPDEGMGPRRQDTMNRQNGPPQRVSLPTLTYNQFFTPADNLNGDQSRHPDEGLGPSYNDRRLHAGRHKPNPVEAQLNKALQKPVDLGRGESMMKKMGWSGGGLGRSGEGIVEPIAPNAAYVSEPRLRNYGTGNISGAAKRRFKRLVDANIPSEQAIHLCRSPLKQLLEEARESNLLEIEEIQDDTVGSDGSLNVCIYNNTLMTEEQMELLHRALNQAILKITTKGIGPKFTGLDHKKGWVLVTCQDELSKDWLLEEIPKLVPWPQAQLTIKDNGDLLMGVMVTVYIPHHEAKSIEEALNLLRVQNSGLNTEVWRVFNGRKVDNGLIVAFTIDEGSLETLKANDLKATLGFTTIHFKIKETNPFATSIRNWFDCGDSEESQERAGSANYGISEGSSYNRSGPIRGFNRGRFGANRGRFGANRGRFRGSFGEYLQQFYDSPPIGQFRVRRGQFGGNRGHIGINRGHFGINRYLGINSGPNEFRRGGG